MEKVVNFRDLGGIRAADGKTVKNGLFFRSAMLNEATEADIAFLKSLNIKTIFDYRDTDEAAMMKTNPYGALGVTYYNIPAAMNNEKLFKLKESRGLGKLFHKFTLDDVKVSYRNLPFGNEGYKAMVRALQNGEVPMLQHCTAGKDRAGLGSALLLLILGARYEDILEDYMKSLEIKDYVQQKVAGFFPSLLLRPIMKRYEPLFIVDKALLDAAVEEIIKRCGTFENYLLIEFGLDESAIQALRDKYTE